MDSSIGFIERMIIEKFSVWNSEPLTIQKFFVTFDCLIIQQEFPIMNLDWCFYQVIEKLLNWLDWCKYAWCLMELIHFGFLWWVCQKLLKFFKWVDFKSVVKLFLRDFSWDELQETYWLDLGLKVHRNCYRNTIQLEPLLG